LSAAGPARVLHIIDGLEGGGSERLLADVVRLSEGRIRHRVTTVYREGARQVGPFVHATPLRALGVYRERPRGAPTRAHPAGTVARSVIAGSRLEGLARFVWTAGTLVGPGTYRALRELMDFRPDVLHAHLYYGFVCGLLLRRLTGRPLVHTVPAMFEQMHDVPWMPRLYARFHPLVDRFFTDYPEELRGVGVPDEKIWWIGGGVDSAAVETAYERRDALRSEVRAKVQLPPDALLALSVGRLHPSKGHDLAAQAVALAARRLPTLHWVVLGQGAERDRLEGLLRELGIADRTRLAGFVTEVLPWYAAADVYLRTTVTEADNLSSRQAMAMGVPVVGFQTGAPTDLLPRVGHGIAVPGPEPALLADAMAHLLGSVDRGRALGLRGRAYARERLGIDTTVEPLAGTYEELAARRTRR